MHTSVRRCDSTLDASIPRHLRSRKIADLHTRPEMEVCSRAVQAALRQRLARPSLARQRLLQRSALGPRGDRSEVGDRTKAPKTPACRRAFSSDEKMARCTKIETLNPELPSTPPGAFSRAVRFCDGRPKDPSLGIKWIPNGVVLWSGRHYQQTPALMPKHTTN